MKALFIGIGSIGQRHLTNFIDIVGSESEILVYRETDHNILIENGIGTPCVSLQKHYGFKQVNSVDDGLREKPDVVFITNPSSKHLDIALKAAHYGCNIFIEKPLSHNLSGVDLLEQTVISKKIVATVGYQTRYHPCYKIVRQILSENKYGDVIWAGFEWGTFLPIHHPYEDYTKGYAAKKKMGGGVVLGLSHEIDMISSFWGQPEVLFSIEGKQDSLVMDAEETVSVLMGFRKNKRLIPVTLFLSYAQKRESREFKIQLNSALIKCDLLNNIITVINNDGKVIDDYDFPDYKRNDLFTEEMSDFLACVKEKTETRVSLRDGIEALKLAMRIKEGING